MLCQGQKLLHYHSYNATRAIVLKYWQISQTVVAYFAGTAVRFAVGVNIWVYEPYSPQFAHACILNRGTHEPGLLQFRYAPSLFTFIQVGTNPAHLGSNMHEPILSLVSPGWCKASS